jgi:polyketide biosynthesis enoyl-CoA hydratase PksH
MPERPITYECCDGVAYLTFSCAAQGNPINEQFLVAFSQLFDQAVATSSSNVIVLRALGRHFCCGMDFVALTDALAGESTQASDHARTKAATLCNLYLDTLLRLTRAPKVVICEVAGNVVGGGVGILAASDLVVSTPSISIRLPEIVWGLVPAMVLPFLCQRIGQRAAYKLVLTAMPLDAAKARDVQLLDEVNANPSAVVKRFVAQVRRADPAGIVRLKRFFEQHGGSGEASLRAAAQTTASLIVDEEVRRKVRAFVEHRIMPWEAGSLGDQPIAPGVE